MERSQYLIDTNAVVDYLGGKLPSIGITFMNDVIDAEPNISVITKIEVLGFNAPPQHYKILSNFIDDVTTLELTTNVVEACIQIRQKNKIRLPDAIIAATALIYDLVLISRNISDFKNIDGLVVVDPHNL